MAGQLRIGIIGTSAYPERWLLPNIPVSAEVTLAAICGRNRTRAEELAARFRIAEVYTDYNEMIARGKLDAIIIATPDSLHYPMTMAALKAGLHVLCEKPMAMNVTEAAEMLEAAERAGVKHQIEFSWRWMPHYRYLHELVAQGYIGRGYHYHYRFLGNRGRVNDYTWRFDPRHSIGVLGDMGSHMLAIALYIHGDVKSVSANLVAFSQRIDPQGQTIDGANESALLALDFADGAQGMIHVSTVAYTAARGREQYVSLHGEGGTLEMEWRVFGGADEGLILRGARQGDEDFQVLEIPEEYVRDLDPAERGLDVLAKQLAGPRLFVDAILRDYMPDPNFRDGFKVQQVLDAAIESHNTGRRIEISL